MYAGRVVEHATTAALFAAPRHRYTEALFKSMPTLELDARHALAAIPGMPPSSSTCRLRAASPPGAAMPSRTAVKGSRSW